MLLVLHVAEDDGVGGTGLLAGCPDAAILHPWQRTTRGAFPRGPRLVARMVLAGDDALDAHRALLHHPELTDDHVGIELHVERDGDLVVPPVEAADVVRTVVAAVARAHAAVVDLPVQPLLGAVGGEHRAHRLARRDLAVLAQHGEEDVVRRVGRALRPPFHADPVELTARGRIGLAHHGNVVLGLTGHHAGQAADTRVDVDGHAPSIARIPVGRVHAGAGRFVAV